MLKLDMVIVYLVLIQMEVKLIMSNIHNEALLETIYDEVWEEYRKNNNLSDDQLYTLEQNSSTGYINEIATIAQQRFEDLCQ